MRPADAQRAPGIPASAVAVAAFFALVALSRPAIPLIDGDVYWHIRAGEQVLDAGSVPKVDTWSIVGEGMRWISQDWLSNVLLALGYRVGEIGPTVLSIGWALLIVLALALLWWAYPRRLPDAGWLGRIIWLAAGLIVAGPTLGVRVQVVDLTLGAAVIVCLWSFETDRHWRWLVVLPVITFLWANLHAGWPLLFLLGGAVVVGELVDRLIGRLSPMPMRDVWRLAIALVASVPVIALNPNGIDLYAYPLQTSSIAAHRDFVSEWQPPDPGTFIGQVFIVFTVVFVLPALWLGLRRLRGADLLTMVGVTIMIISGARFLLLAPLIAATAGLAIEPALAETRVGRRFGPILSRLGTPRRSGVFSLVNGALVATMVAAGIGVTWARTAQSVQTDMVDDHMPVAAVDWIIANDPGDRPFNQYSWGGYLGLRVPSDPIYIDGRSDIYGDDPIREYADAVTLRTDPGALLDRRAIDYVLFPLDQPLAGWLDDSDGWRRVYADDLAGVWVRG
jgi:MFS family permease